MSDKVTSSQVAADLDQIVLLTNSMLECARSGEWEQLVQLEQQRRTLVEQVFPLEDPQEDVPFVIKQMEQVKKLDQELLELVAEGRAEAAELLNKLSSGRSAIAAYKVNTGK